MNEHLTLRRIDIEPGPDKATEDVPTSPHPIVVGGGPAGAPFRLDPGGNRLGRASDNSLVRPDESLSRYHAFLWMDEAGVVWLNDQDSTNGTYRNGERLPRQTQVRINHGDRLRFGLSLAFRIARLMPAEEQTQRQLYESLFRKSVQDVAGG